MGIKSSRIRLVGRLIKYLILALALGIAGILLWRIFSSSSPSSMKGLAVDGALYEAYSENDGKLSAFKQGQNTITRTEKNYGYFSITECIFIPEAKQVQIVFRYNNSTIKHLAADYSLEEIPSRHSDLYDVTLVVSHDLTPDITSDNDTARPGEVELIRYHASESFKDEKNLYNYRRFIFNDVDIFDGNTMSGETLAVYADIFYNMDIGYQKEDFDIYKDTAYGTLCLYDYASKKLPYSLTSGEKKAFEEYK